MGCGPFDCGENRRHGGGAAAFGGQTCESPQGLRRGGFAPGAGRADGTSDGRDDSPGDIGEGGEGGKENALWGVTLHALRKLPASD